YARRALDAARAVGPSSRARHLRPAWIASYLRNRFGPRHAFADYRGAADSGVYALESGGGSVRVSIAGDWASGTDEAAAVAAAMAAWNPHFTIHLGDVYYVGDEAEVRSTFLGERTSSYQPTQWPRGSIASFALNGNHEMYARGAPYFDLLSANDAIDRKSTRLNSSHSQNSYAVFCLKKKKEKQDRWIRI